MLWLFCYSYRPYKKILCGEKKQKVEGIQQIALLSLIALTLISDVSLIYMFSFFSVALTPDNVFGSINLLLSINHFLNLNTTSLILVITYWLPPQLHALHITIFY